MKNLKLKFWRRAPSLKLEDNFPIKKKRFFHLLFERRGGLELIIGISIGGTVYGLTVGGWITVVLIVASIIYTICSKPKRPESEVGSGDFGNSGFLANLTSQNEPVRVSYGVFRIDGAVIYRGK